MLQEISATVSVKKFILIIFSSIFIWINPIAPLLLLIIAAVLLDTIFGVYASYRLDKPILSRKLQRIVVKCALYCSSLLLFYGIDYLILNSIIIPRLDIDLFLTKSVALGFILIELFSVDEKVRSLNNGKGFNHFIDKVYRFILNIKRKISAITENQQPPI